MYNWHLKSGMKFSLFNIVSSKEINNFHPEVSKPSDSELILCGSNHICDLGLRDPNSVTTLEFKSILA